LPKSLPPTRDNFGLRWQSVEADHRPATALLRGLPNRLPNTKAMFASHGGASVPASRTQANSDTQPKAPGKPATILDCGGKQSATPL
jgi:hypothetical protein